MRLGGWKLPLERLSATSLSTYLVCPEQFRRKYLLKETEKMSGDRFIGIVTHDSLHRLFTQEVHVGDDASKIVDASWAETIEKKGEPEWHETDAAESYRRTKQMLTIYWPIASEVKPVAVEQRFEEKILGVPIVGYIDLELPEVIREVKTSTAKQSSPKSRHLFQGRLYSLVSSKPVEWHYVTRQVTPKVYTPKECPSLTKSFNSEPTLLIVSRAIESMNEDFARLGANNPWGMNGIFGDWTCRYCSFQKSCPAW